MISSNFFSQLGEASKTFREGTDRIVSPEETLARVRPHLPKLGITRIANVTGLDHIGIPVVMVCRPNSRALSVSQGKGATVAAAKASGVMESIETYHAERVRLPLRLGSYEEMRANARVVDVSRLNRPRESVFHPDLPLLWTEGYDLLQREPVFVPYEMVHANFTPPQPAGSGCFSLTSNGLASGNHILEAVSHGICELVERDSMTLWSLAGADAQRPTRLELETVDDPMCLEVLGRLHEARMPVAVWDMTSDVGIPAFVCVFADPSEASFGRITDYIGYGCHPMRHIALLRALTEAAQMRLTIIAGSRDDLDAVHYRPIAPDDPPAQGRRIDWQDTSGPRRDFRTIAHRNETSFEGEVAWQLERLRAAGIERVVAVNLTLPEFEIPVVRMIIPGLEMAFMDLKYFALGARARKAREKR